MDETKRMEILTHISQAGSEIGNARMSTFDAESNHCISSELTLLILDETKKLRDNIEETYMKIIQAITDELQDQNKKTLGEITKVTL